jgi:hypothetical protein
MAVDDDAASRAAVDDDDVESHATSNAVAAGLRAAGLNNVPGVFSSSSSSAPGAPSAAPSLPSASPRTQSDEPSLLSREFKFDMFPEEMGAPERLDTREVLTLLGDLINSLQVSNARTTIHVDPVPVAEPLDIKGIIEEIRADARTFQAKFLEDEEGIGTDVPPVFVEMINFLHEDNSKKFEELKEEFRAADPQLQEAKALREVLTTQIESINPSPVVQLTSTSDDLNMLTEFVHSVRVDETNRIHALQHTFLSAETKTEDVVTSLELFIQTQRQQENKNIDVLKQAILSFPDNPMPEAIQQLAAFVNTLREPKELGPEDVQMGVPMGTPNVLPSISKPAVESVGHSDCISNAEVRKWETILRSSLQYVLSTTSMMKRMYYDETSDSKRVADLLRWDPKQNALNQLGNFRDNIEEVARQIRTIDFKSVDMKLRPLDASGAPPMEDVVMKRSDPEISSTFNKVIGSTVVSFIQAFSPWTLTLDDSSFTISKPPSVDQQMFDATIKHLTTLPAVLLDLSLAHEKAFKHLERKGFQLEPLTYSYLDYIVPVDIQSMLQQSRRDVQSAIVKSFSELKNNMNELADYFGFLLTDFASRAFGEVVVKIQNPKDQREVLNRYNAFMNQAMDQAGNRNWKSVTTNRLAALANEMIVVKAERSEWKQVAGNLDAVVRWITEQLQGWAQEAKLEVGPSSEHTSYDEYLVTLIPQLDDPEVIKKYKDNIMQLSNYGDQIKAWFKASVDNVRGDRKSLEVYKSQGISLYNLLAQTLPQEALRTTAFGRYRLEDPKEFDRAVAWITGVVAGDSKGVSDALRNGPIAQRAPSGSAPTEMEVWSANPTTMYDFIFRTQAFKLSPEDAKILSSNSDLDKVVLFASFVAGETKVNVVRLIKLDWLLSHAEENQSVPDRLMNFHLREDVKLKSDAILLLTKLQSDESRQDATETLAVRILSPAMYNAYRVTMSSLKKTRDGLVTRKGVRVKNVHFDFDSMILKDKSPVGSERFFSFSQLVAMQYSINEQITTNVIGYTDRDTGVNNRRSQKPALSRNDNAYLQMVANYRILANNFFRDFVLA